MSKYFKAYNAIKNLVKSSKPKGEVIKKVKNRKQAIAIALREAGVKQKRSKNGKRK